MSVTAQATVPRKVTVIPIDPQMVQQDIRKKHLRVAPYCRVSTDKEEQLSSYEAQIEYYTDKINSNPDWTMVRLYADEGITGTSARKRKDFLKMVRDCQRGKIDLVITKSVSRFCRNTLDGLNYVRRLKGYGVGVYFEKENVNTLYMDNEMILTFMMSQAQAESESLSGNVKWGHRKNFKDGKVYYNYKGFLGYRKGPDGQPEVDPEQAEIVRRIFSRYLLGHSVRQIVTDLMADGIKTATGKEVWHNSVVQKMLCNEKYIGDALLQKTYVADLFTREKRVNCGELPKYYVHDCHPAIIDRETFQKVQEEMARRSSLRKTSSKTKTELGKYSGKYVLSELMVCGECGSPYRRVVWTQKGVKRVVWRCQNRLEHGRKLCKQSPTWDEADIHGAVVSAMNELFQMQAAKDALKASLAAVLSGEEQEWSLPAVEAQIRRLQDRQLEIFQLIVGAGPQCTDYDEELQQVNMAKTRLMAKKAELERTQQGASALEERLKSIGSTLDETSAALADFDELTVRQLVSNIKVLDRDSLLVRFKDGTELVRQKGSMMEYREVYFRIWSRYQYNSGWPDEKDMQSFQMETRALFQKAGWELHPARERSGVCDTVTKGQQDLYLHPMNFSGVIQVDEIPQIQELLTGAKTFRCSGVDCYERYWELSDEEYLAQLESKREEITQAILERYQTKRKNLYVTGPAVLNIAKQFSVRRLCDKDGKRNLANQFAEELVEQLIQDGQLVTAETKNGLGIRTATRAELSRDLDSPLPGQQQMTL